MPIFDPATATWRKSSRSNLENACVELADATPAVAVRDSKRPTQQHLSADRTAWAAFAHATRTGRFDFG